MKIRRVFFSILILTSSGLSNPPIPLITRPIQLLRRAVAANMLTIDRVENGGKFLKDIETAKESGEVEKLSRDATPPSNFLKSPSTVDADCPPTRVRRRRDMLLVRRGCPGALGHGLVNMGDKLTDAGERLINYDKFLATLSRKEKAKLFLKKIGGGIKTAVVVPIKTVGRYAKKLGLGVLDGFKLVGGGVLLGGYNLGVYGWKGLKLLHRGFLNGWGKIGKGIAATGKAVQKAGDKMQAHAVRRVHKPK